MICMHRSLPSIILKGSHILSTSKKIWDMGTPITYFSLFFTLKHLSVLQRVFGQFYWIAQIQILSLSLVLMEQLTWGEMLLCGYD